MSYSVYRGSVLGFFLLYLLCYSDGNLKHKGKPDGTLTVPDGMKTAAEAARRDRGIGRALSEWPSAMMCERGKGGGVT